MIAVLRHHGRTHAPALAIALGSFVLLLVVSYGVFSGFPFCMDEYGNWYQAEIFAQGKTHLETPGAGLEALREQYVVWHDGQVFSKYPPGYSMVLALGVLIGAPAAINPLIGALTVLLVYVAAYRIVGKPYALIAQLLVATNPYFVAYSASYYAHSLTLLLALVLIVQLSDPSPPRPQRWIAIGVVLGVFVWVRPVDALCGALFVLHLTVRLIGWRKAFVAGLWAIGPFVALALLLMLYNDGLSGRFALSTYPTSVYEFRLVADPALGLWDNIVELTDEYVRRLVVWGEALWWRYFLWPTAFVIPLLALLSFGLRAGERRWRLALCWYFVITVLLYNFHAMPLTIPTWPQYGVRYWYAGFGALVLLAMMAAKNLVERAAGSRSIPARFKTREIGFALIGGVIFLQCLIGGSLFREYRQRFDVVFAIHEEIAAACPGKRIVGLVLPRRPYLPTFVAPSDFRRNPFFDGERLYVYGPVPDAVLTAFPGYTACTYDFARWDTAR